MGNSIILAALHSQTNNNNGNDWSSMLVMIGQFFSLIIIFAIILYLAYYSTKLVAKARIGGLKSNNMKVIDSIGVGIRCSVQLIKVGEQFFLISVNRDSVTFLTEVKKDSIVEAEYETKPLNFEKYLKDYIEKYKNKK